MKRRAAQVGGLLLCVLGWGTVGCTLALDGWRVARVGGQAGSSVVSTARFWSDLWKDCHQDSTAIINCVDLGVLWEVKADIQAARGLLVGGLCMGLCGLVLTLVGMECTRIGGDPRSDDRTLAAACAFQLLGCVSDVAAYCLYINKVVAAFLHSKADPSTLSYEVGLPVYLGLVASSLIFLGSAINCCTACIRPQHRTAPPHPSIREEEEEMEVMRQKRQRNLSTRISKNSYQTTSVVIV